MLKATVSTALVIVFGTVLIWAIRESDWLIAGASLLMGVACALLEIHGKGDSA